MEMLVVDGEDKQTLVETLYELEEAKSEMRIWLGLTRQPYSPYGNIRTMVWYNTEGKYENEINPHPAILFYFI